MSKNENLGPCTKLNQKCVVKSSGWPHQNVSIYFTLPYMVWSSIVIVDEKSYFLFRFFEISQKRLKLLFSIIEQIKYIFITYIRVDSLERPPDWLAGQAGLACNCGTALDIYDYLIAIFCKHSTIPLKNNIYSFKESSSLLNKKNCNVFKKDQNEY